MKISPAVLLLLCAWLPSCASLPSWVPGSRAAPARLSADEVPAAIERAEQDLAAGRASKALDWMRAASAAKGLDTQTRDHVQRVLEQAATRRIDELSAPGQDPDDLAELVELGLPRQIAVQAGLAAARRLVEDGERMDAFRLLRKLDKKFPLHHEHRAAGDLLDEIGLELSGENKSFLFFWNTDSQAEEVLEYAILNHPSARQDDLAHQRLAELYEEHNDLDLAIDRLEKLVLDHPDSALRPEAQAHIPELRLKLLRSPEYDRGSLLKAEEELKRWLQSFPGHELEPRVALDLADCLRRLCDSDMAIAAFYRRVDNTYGARYHAQRAVTEARDAADEARAARSQAFVESLPPDPAADAPQKGVP